MNEVLEEVRQCSQENRSFGEGLSCNLQIFKELLRTVEDLCGHREQN